MPFPRSINRGLIFQRPRHLQLWQNDEELRLDLGLGYHLHCRCQCQLSSNIRVSFFSFPKQLQNAIHFLNFDLAGVSTVFPNVAKHAANLLPEKPWLAMTVLANVDFATFALALPTLFPIVLVGVRNPSNLAPKNVTVAKLFVWPVLPNAAFTDVCNWPLKCIFFLDPKNVYKSVKGCVI